ncbi:MAG: PPOX class F420-dependent oxidoreductase [Chloroflexota bacterium]|nr:PPOX class F420-dependent oxidoreductase [Chloroflexota bacterium]
MLPESVRELIATGPLVHLTTLNADGSPQVTVVWIGIDGDEFVSAHMSEHQKIKNVRRDPRIALSMLGPGVNPIGMREYVVVHGTARVTEGGAAPLLQRLTQVYLGPGVEFPPARASDRLGYILHFRPERYTGLGPWALR